MTVSTIGSVAEFETNGVTTNYPFYFKFLANEDLVVTYVDPLGAISTLTLGTQYTANGAGNEQGGSIVTTSVLAGPGKLIVSREMEAFQQTSLRNQGKFLAETHEDVFDKLTMLIQQGFSIFARALVRPIGKSYYNAEGRNISNLADPAKDQDAATKKWAETYIAQILSTGQGPINNAANVVIADVANWFASLSVEGALAELGGRAVMGAPGRGYNLLSGVIAANGGPLAFINDAGHRPTGFSLTLSQPNAYSTTVNFLENSSKVSNFVVVPDETYAVAGIVAGASVFTDRAVIQASAPLTMKYAGFNAITAQPLWNAGGLIGNTLLPNNGGVKITHPQATPNTVPVVCALSATGAPGVQLAISDYTDNDVTVVAIDDMNGYISFNGTTWTQSLSNNVIAPASIIFSGGNLVVTHQDVGTEAYSVTLSAFSTAYQVVLANVSSTMFTVQFYTAAGVLVTVADSSMKFMYRRNAKVVRNMNGVTFSLDRGRCYVPNAAYQNLPAGNYWMAGVMEK